MSKSIVTSEQVFKALRDIFPEIPELCTAVVIRCGVGEVVTIDVTFNPTEAYRFVAE